DLVPRRLALEGQGEVGALMRPADPEGQLTTFERDVLGVAIHAGQPGEPPLEALAGSGDGEDRCVFLAIRRGELQVPGAGQVAGIEVLGRRPDGDDGY